MRSLGVQISVSVRKSYSSLQPKPETSKSYDRTFGAFMSINGAIEIDDTNISILDENMILVIVEVAMLDDKIVY